METGTRLSFTELARLKAPCEATVCYGDRRIVLKGTLTVDHQRGSYRYGPQLQVHLFSTNAPLFEERCERKKFTRIEIAISDIQAGFNFLNEAVNTFRFSRRS